MDGTLTRPWFNFNRVRDEIGLPEPLLETMIAMPPGPERDRAWTILERYEREAIAASELNEGAKETVDWLRAAGLACGLVTRNSRWSLEETLKKHGLVFDGTMSRDDGPVKPRPEPIWALCTRFAVEPGEALLVGDYKYDVIAGRNAGTRTALLLNGARPKFLDEHPPDFVIERLEGLRVILEGRSAPPARP